MSKKASLPQGYEPQQNNKSPVNFSNFLWVRYTIEAAHLGNITTTHDQTSFNHLIRLPHLAYLKKDYWDG